MSKGRIWQVILAGALTRSMVLGAILEGRVLDAETGMPLPCRIHVQSEQGRWLFAESTGEGGSAVRYQKTNWNDRQATEQHTTLSAHPFRVEMPPGRYQVRVEHGKEYHPLQLSLEVPQEGMKVTFPLKRWVNMAEQGWYSGDTHVHRTVEELPNVMLAEDLNVALPLTYWVTQGAVPPTGGDKTAPLGAGAGPIAVDSTHVIQTMNTEYEIFSVGGRRHTLGALFVLNHKAPLELGVPPVVPVAEEARRQGALLDLDKHNWPWSMALIPLVKPDLFELANNHHWQTRFAITNWSVPAPAWMEIGNGSENERQWTLYGFQTYYALLNSGFRLRPSAGTASGVHPVPLGFGRVYVHLDGEFSLDAWMLGLKEGRSFVTTGPMLWGELEGEPLGGTVPLQPGIPPSITLKGAVHSRERIEEVEMIWNGQVVRRIDPRQTQGRQGGWVGAIAESWIPDGSGWMALRCWEAHAEGRVRFAHTSPIHVEIPGAPLKPRRREVAWLLAQVREERARSESRLSEAALAEYDRALNSYEELLHKAVE